MATMINAFAEAKTPQLKKFTNWYTPRQARKLLSLVYTRLTNYILLDLGEDDLCSNEEKLPEAMEILRELIDGIDEMEDISSRQLSVINNGDGAEQEN